jgi:hypothetical protein
VSRARRPARHPAHLPGALGQVDGEPVGEGGHDDADQPGEGVVVGLEGGGHLVTGQGQDGQMEPGVLGPQAAPAGVLVQPGPLDRSGRPVGHQLQETEVPGYEPVLLARPDLDHSDDVAPDEQGSGHERHHSPARAKWPASVSATSFTMTASARWATAPTTPSPIPMATPAAGSAGPREARTVRL